MPACGLVLSGVEAGVDQYLTLFSPCSRFDRGPITRPTDREQKGERDKRRAQNRSEIRAAVHDNEEGEDHQSTNCEHVERTATRHQHETHGEESQSDQ